MKLKILLLLLSCIAVLISGCGSSPEMIATQTSISATITAESWTPTPTLTPSITPTPTLSPTPTPTSTPTLIPLSEIALSKIVLQNNEVLKPMRFDGQITDALALGSIYFNGQPNIIKGIESAYLKSYTQDMPESQYVGVTPDTRDLINCIFIFKDTNLASDAYWFLLGSSPGGATSSIEPPIGDESFSSSVSANSFDFRFSMDVRYVVGNIVAWQYEEAVGIIQYHVEALPMDDDYTDISSIVSLARNVQKRLVDSR